MVIRSLLLIYFLILSDIVTPNTREYFSGLASFNIKSYLIIKNQIETNKFDN